MISYIVTFAVIMCVSLSMAQELLTVPMTVGDNQYQVRFNPTTDSVASVARNFCIQQAESLGYSPQNPLTDENLGGCTGPIQEFLSNAVTVERSQRTETANLLRVQVTIGDNTYEVRFNPAQEEVHAVARNFCIQQAETLGYTPQNPLTDENLPDCVNPVADYLYKAALRNRDERLRAAGLLAVPVTVGDNTYEVRFKPASEALSTVARNFCIQQADSLGFTSQNPLTDTNLPDCLNPVAEYLRTYAANVGVQTVADATLTIGQPSRVALSKTTERYRVTVRVPGTRYGATPRQTLDSYVSTEAGHPGSMSVLMPGVLVIFTFHLFCYY